MNPESTVIMAIASTWGIPLNDVRFMEEKDGLCRFALKYDAGWLAIYVPTHVMHSHSEIVRHVVSSHMEYHKETSQVVSPYLSVLSPF